MNALYYQLYHLWKIEPELVVIGSLSLYWHGLLNREPTDLDILVRTLGNELKDLDTNSDLDFSSYKMIQKNRNDNIDKVIFNSNLEKYLNSQLSIRDRSEEESDNLDIAFSCVGQDSKVKIDLFPLDIQKEDQLIKLITASTEDGEIAFEVNYSDWTHVVPYKIKYYSGNKKHYDDIVYIKDKLEEFEGTEDAYQISIPGTLDHKVYKQINKFLDENDPEDHELIF